VERVEVEGIDEKGRREGGKEELRMDPHFILVDLPVEPAKEPNRPTRRG